jgi:phage replication O-like protein O
MSNLAQRRTVHPFAEQGKFTAVHNSVFDVIMPSLPPNAFKVLCFVIRKTVGWQKESDQLAYSQIAKGTGIKSPATLSTAIEVLVSRKYILSTSDSKWEATSYRLNTDLEIEVTPTTENEVDNSATKNEATTEIVVATTSINVVVPTSKIEDTKERLKEKKESGGETHARPLSELALTIADVCKINPKIATEKQKRTLNATYQALKGIGATAIDVRARESWWYANDWRAKKEGRAPRPDELQAIWEEAAAPVKKQPANTTSGPIVASKPNIAPDALSREELAAAAKAYRNGTTSRTTTE